MSESVDIDVGNLDAEADALQAKLGPTPEVQQQQETEAQAVQLRDTAAEEWAGICQLALGPAFQVLAPNWAVSKEELGMLAEAYGPCFAEIFPDTSSAGPWVGAVLTTAMVVGPRLGTPRRLPEENPDGGDNAEA